jgi:tetratricopeptide (TPR) repeat protein
VSRTHLFSKLWANKNPRLAPLNRSWIGLLLLCSFFPSAAAHAIDRADSACTANERWSFDSDTQNELPPGFQDEFLAFLSHQTSVARSFSEAMALRKAAHSEKIKLFSEYWLSRALYDAGLFGIATRAFNTLVAKPIAPHHSGIQLAALQCLTLIHNQYSVLGFSRAAQNQIPLYFRLDLDSKARAALLEAATQLFLEKLGENASVSEMNLLLALFKESGSNSAYVRGLWAVRLGKNDAVIRELSGLLTNETLPPYLAAVKDQMRLFLARAYYALGQYKTAIVYYRAMSKVNREFPHTLAELSWAQLRAGNYPEAIGIGISNQSSWMKTTFTPEPWMVSAMALNEICRFPEALHMISLFRSEYREAFRWLQSRTSAKVPPKISLYRQALSFLKKDPAADSIPHRIANEWVRSPVFISHQEGLNLILHENQAIVTLGKAGQREQKERAVRLLKETSQLRKEYRLAKIRLKPGEDIPSGLKEELKRLISEITHYNRLAAGAPIWRMISASFVQNVPASQKELISEIEAELASLNRSMLELLIEISENNELIEVEIYNGASTDMVWKNAHPGAKTQANGNAARNEDSANNSAEIYDWGKNPGTLTDGGEMWEDELDSMKANLADHCAKGTKYLKVGK